MSEDDKSGRPRKALRLLMITGITMLCLFGLGAIVVAVLFAHAMSSYGSNK
jgi:hypothetical protein